MTTCNMILGLGAALVMTSGTSFGAEWTVPLAGNAYRTKASEKAPGRVDGEGISRWQEGETTFSVYFRADRAAVLDLALRMKVPKGKSEIRVKVDGTSLDQTVTGEGEQEVKLGSVTVKAGGYVKLDLTGVRKDGEVFADVKDLVVESATEGLELNYVRDNVDGRFYWGRRGPSVHLPYVAPAGKTIEYFYNEITVPNGQDPIGSYFMANGFGEGYFGMQVNSPQERRVLFSVWSPFSTDNPKEIPEDQKIKVLAKGAETRTGEFGNEGSGGQSFMLYPWKTGRTYRFLNRVTPDGNGNTKYTAWFFAPETGKWQLVASFLRPKTDKHMTGMHSFLENFSDRNGYLSRAAIYGNQWARDTDGTWHQIVKSGFSGDDIASRKYRLDYAGGVRDGGFFLRNGGFFDEPVKLGSQFERPAGDAKAPEIDFKSLEGAE